MIEFEGRKPMRTLEEIAEEASKIGRTLPNETPLKVLFTWPNRENLSEDLRSFFSPDWYRFGTQLDPPEKTLLTRAIGLALRAKINSLGELRTTNETVLADLVPDGNKIRIGEKFAGALKICFSEPTQPS